VREDPELDHNQIAEKLSETLKTTESADTSAAVVVLLRLADQDFQVLFVKRAEKLTDPWSGQTAFPGGKRDPEDKDLKETVVRETLEETGINIFVRCRLLGAMESMRSTQRPEMKILPFVLLQEKEQEIKLNEELTEYFWTPLKEMDLNKGCIKYRCEDFPAFIIGGNVIWGLTYRILYNLLASLSSFEKETQRKA
jgi:8-oxo-dGTP pyrophosphatase MutT (NUDIX family)